eukprot:7106884-Pyramimonas_sp.AAC.1
MTRPPPVNLPLAIQTCRRARQPPPPVPNHHLPDPHYPPPSGEAVAHYGNVSFEEKEKELQEQVSRITIRRDVYRVLSLTAVYSQY